MTKKRVSLRLIFIAIWNNKILTSLLDEIIVPPCFALRPRVFLWDPCFPPDPVFSTRPRVFHQTPCFPHPGTPYPGTLAPRSPPNLALVLRLLRYTIGLKNSRQFFIQSEVKPKPIVTHSHTFSRALRQLPVITSSFDWSTVMCLFFVIG